MNSNGLSGDERLDPELRPIVEVLRTKAAARPPMASVTPEQMRLRAAEEFVPWNRDPEAIASLQDLVAVGMKVRLYDSAPGVLTGLLVYAHGGGWVIGDLELEDAALRRLSISSGQRILSVDYRLAPEHPFPRQLDDIESVFRWAATGPAELGIKPQKIALGGASAGANLALGTALRLRDFGRPMPTFLLLMYGAFAGGVETGSSLEFGDGRFGLPATAMAYFWNIYAGSVNSATLGYAIPLRADLGGLPAVFANYAGLDVLRDDTILLVERLKAAGVLVNHRAYPGAIHGFTQYVKSSALARFALDEAGAALRDAIG